MTITRLWSSGAESGSVEELDLYSSRTIIVTTKYTGTYAFQGQSAGAPLGPLGVNVPGTRQIRTGFRMQMATPSNPTWYNIAQFKNSTTGLVQLQFHVGTRELRIYTNGVLRDFTANNAFEYGTWYHWGMDAKVDSSTGYVKFYLDGVELLSWSGDTGNLDVDNVRYCSEGSTFGGGCAWQFDDMFIDDMTGEAAPTRVPLKRLYAVFPNGNGNYADWEGSDGNKVDNYLLVDEKPPSDADYVQAVGLDEFDSYAMDTFTLATNELLLALIPTARAYRGGATEELALGTRLSSTDLVGSDQALSGSFLYYQERQIAKPGGGDWDQAALDAVEAVIKSRGSF